MIRAFSGKTADDVWRQAISTLQSDELSSFEQSRLGAMREILHANLYIENPRQRWVTSRLPAMNPAFAIAEVFWILSGSNDASFINFWNPALPKFVGNFEKYHGAYGYRIINHFGVNQLERAYHALKKNPTSRQVVIQIWDAKSDLPNEDGVPVSLDIPCNLFSMLKIREGKLEWTQVMRSNDLYRGTPYNIVQFTMLQEILAGWLDLKLGGYYQISDSLHIYEKDCIELKASIKKSNIENSDNLSISKNEFDIIFKILLDKFIILSKKYLSISEFKQVVETNNIPDSYRNLLLTVAVDSARRRGYFPEMNLLLDQFTNPMLFLLSNSWIERFKKGNKRGSSLHPTQKEKI
ncbi:thymidylate synthase [Geobacter sp. AOG2]|uniref:thymidylate synthase n=1 Tax=Geobacter sp. AOG2 TaxID=1566347 RepID=UPI001CC6622D|nr:thymidylate synthase [Geobacter sp. AOG2]GFE59576.1 hypothetical protein AOG2_01640 [Geobacter sp. AOG2]